MNESKIVEKMPVLALRGMTVFPEQTVHFDIGRVKSALALEASMKSDQSIFLVSQKNIVNDDPDFKDLYPIGTVAKIKQILRSQGENIRVLVTGLYRAKIIDPVQFTPYLRGTVEQVTELNCPDTLRTRALRREANTLYANYLELIEHSAQF